MGRGPEGKIQDAVIRYARFEKDVLCRKNETGAYHVSSGWLDYAIYPGRGRVFFIEFKAPGGKLTPLQQHMWNDLVSRGYHCYLVDDILKGKLIIDRECS